VLGRCDEGVTGWYEKPGHCAGLHEKRCKVWREIALV
jgi:hypothetical protein